MFPTQDHNQGLGNVIALPLQGKALKMVIVLLLMKIGMLIMINGWFLIKLID